MVHANGLQQELISTKIDRINDQLKHSDEKVPNFSVSVGVVYGADADDAESLFERADEAMYQSKKDGKQTYTFYQKG